MPIRIGDGSIRVEIDRRVVATAPSGWLVAGSDLLAPVLRQQPGDHQADGH